MERKISVSDLRKAVDAAYEAVKSEKDGEIDPCNFGAKAGEFGISVVLPDGTTINKGDTQVKSPMGKIAKIPLFSLLLEQNGVDNLVKKSGTCPCHKVPEKPQVLKFDPHFMRAFSAVEPTGDADSKWNLYINRVIDMMGSAPEMNDKLFEYLQKEAQESKLVDTLAADGYYLYDDASIAADLVEKAMSMTAGTEQLARMGATVLADGVNPETKAEVFDGRYSQNIIGMMAAKGPHKMNLPWLVKAGIPAKRSFGGAMLGILPGTLSIAAYAPELNPAGVSVKAAKAIMHVMRELDLSAFASARVKFVND